MTQVSKPKQIKLNSVSTGDKMDLNAKINLQKLSGYDSQQMMEVMTVLGRSWAIMYEIQGPNPPPVTQVAQVPPPLNLICTLTLCVSSKYFWHAS